jgi:hypothetical protein
MEFLNKTLDLKAFSFPVGARDFKSELMIEKLVDQIGFSHSATAIYNDQLGL